jgi:hypothetical protein
MDNDDAVRPSPILHPCPFTTAAPNHATETSPSKPPAKILAIADDTTTTSNTKTTTSGLVNYPLHPAAVIPAA